MRASDIIGSLCVGDHPPRHRFDAELERLARALGLFEFVNCAERVGRLDAGEGAPYAPFSRHVWRFLPTGLTLRIWTLMALPPPHEVRWWRQ